MGYVLTRLFLVVLGYMLAIAAAATVIILPMWMPLIQDTGLTDADTVFVVSQWFLVFFMLGTMAFPFAAVAIIVSEMLVLRSWLAYAGIGAVIAYILSFAVQRMQQLNLDVPLELAWLDVRELLRVTPAETLAAGFSAGLAYWLIAGAPGARAKRQKHDADMAQPNNPQSSQPQT